MMLQILMISGRKVVRTEGIELPESNIVDLKDSYKYLFDWITNQSFLKDRIA